MTDCHRICAPWLMQMDQPGLRGNKPCQLLHLAQEGAGISALAKDHRICMSRRFLLLHHGPKHRDEQAFFPCQPALASRAERVGINETAAAGASHGIDDQHEAQRDHRIQSVRIDLQRLFQ